MVVLRGSAFEFRELDRHSVNVVEPERRALQQTLAQVRQVAIWIAGRSNALVNLKDLHLVPWHVFIGQVAQHNPWSMATAHGEAELAARRYRFTRIPGDERGSALGHSIGIGENFRLACSSSLANSIGGLKSACRMKQGLFGTTEVVP